MYSLGLSPQSTVINFQNQQSVFPDIETLASMSLEGDSQKGIQWHLFLHFYLFVCLLVCVCVCVHAGAHGTHVEVREQLQSWFFPSTMCVCVLGIQLRLSGLVANGFIHWKFSPALLSHWEPFCKGLAIWGTAWTMIITLGICKSVDGDKWASKEVNTEPDAEDA